MLTRGWHSALILVQHMVSAGCLFACRDVAGKIKDTATSALETITGSKQQQKPVRRQEQRGAPLYKPEGVLGCFCGLHSNCLTVAACMRGKDTFDMIHCMLCQHGALLDR